MGAVTEDPHPDLLARGHSAEEGPVAAAEARAATISTDTRPLGQPG